MHEWLTGLCASVIHSWLSTWIVIADTCLNPISSSRVQSQIASFVAFDVAMYSDSTVDSATVGCFFDDHATLLPAMSKINPPIDHLVSGSWA